MSKQARTSWLDCIPRRLAAALLPVFGVFALATPLVMWMAWEPDILGYGIGIGVGSLFIAALLAASLAPDAMDPADEEAWRRTYEAFHAPTTTKRSDQPSWRDQA